MTLSEDLQWRGLIKDKTFGDISWLDQPKVFYHGIDGSSDSLQIGNLAVLILSRRFIKAGWQAVLLTGGATSLVGDPGGKDNERELRPKEEIEHNVAAIKSQMEKLFTGLPVTYVNNIDWFSGIGYLDFLRDIGKHYSMTELTQRDYVAQRMGEHGSGISYAELSYSLIQGYDFWHLFTKHQAVLQIGGSDQWGNMLSGVPLIRKKENAEAHVMTMPLVVNKSTGIKFGKTEEGAIWLDAAKTTPFQFYQFWLNTEDDAVEDYLKVFTELDKQQIDKLMADFSSDRAGRLAQRSLAGELTKLVHGEEAVKQIEDASAAAYGDSELTPESIPILKSQLPVGSAQVGSTTIIEALVQTGLAASNSDARRLISEGAIYINGQRVSGKETFEANDNLHGHALLQRGKSKAIIQLSE